MLFSIILPTYNSTAYILDTLNCILNQSFTDFELIIIDDCSTDNTFDILCNYQTYDKRINVFRNSINHGVAYSRNLGIDRSNGDYIIFWDSDDLASCDRLLFQSKIVTKYLEDVFYSGYFIIDSFGNILFYKHVRDFLDKSSFYIENPIPNLTALIKRLSIGKLRFRLNVKHEDSLFYFDLFNANLKFKKVNLETHFFYRYHTTSLSGRKIQSLMWRFYNLKYDFGLRPVIAFRYFLAYLFKNIYKYFLLKFRSKFLGLFFKPLNLNNENIVNR